MQVDEDRDRAMRRIQYYLDSMSPSELRALEIELGDRAKPRMQPPNYGQLVQIGKSNPWKLGGDAA